MHPSIVHVLLDTANAAGTAPALRHKADGRWESISWQQYAQRVRRTARGLIKLGLQPGDAVAIVGRNCPEWVIGNLAVMAAGGAPAPFYTNSTAEQARYVIEHCGASILIADTPEQIDKVRSSQLSCVAHCVQMQGTVESKDGLITSAELEALGEQVPESELDDRLKKLEPATLATLIYTSGTTGPPKAAMLSHGNLVFTAQTVRDTLGTFPNDRLLSYLPLSHIAEQMVSMYVPIACGLPVSFAESLEMLGENLREVRPTVFVGVPRVWEKIQAKMVAAGRASSPLKRRVAAWARRQGLEASRRAESGRPPQLAYWLAHRLVFAKVRERLGLDQARHCVTAGAPIAQSTLEFFFSLDIPLYEIYGMTECTGPGTASRPERFRMGKAGPPLPGTEIKTAEDGEVCLRGNHVFMGYLNAPEATAEAIDAEGWLHTGDIGEIDSEGFLSVTDRKKDLLITAGGKNVAPQNIEALLKGIPGIGQACVVGDGEKFLTALLAIDRETAQATAEQCGAGTSDAEKLHADPTYRAYVQQHVTAINAGLARFETIKRFTLLPNELTIDNDELTPTMKMKRKVVVQRYRRQIEAMYESGESSETAA